MQWARAYVEFAAGEKRAWLTGHGITFLPTVGWAERGDLRADGHGNSVPRFHVAWGTGTGVVEPFVDSALEAAEARAGRPSTTGTGSTNWSSPTAPSPGCAAPCWRPTTPSRGAPSNRDAVGEFELHRAGRHRHHRRHRRQPRHRAPLLAGAAGHRHRSR